MRDATPLISIAIPTKNRAALLCETLRSLQNQTYTHWEARVVDDHSTDDTASVVAAEFGGDKRVHFSLREGAKSGAPVCRNQGMRASRADYIIFLDSDDLLAPHCLENRVAVMERDTGLDFAVFQGESFAQEPGDLKQPWCEFTEESPLFRFLQRTPVWQTSGPIWRKSSLDAMGQWDESLICWQDFDWHLRSLILKRRYVLNNAVDYYIRRNPASSDNIYIHNSSPEHISTRLRLFRNATKMIQETDLYTPYTKGLLRDSFFRIAEEWIGRHGDLSRAHETWHASFEEGLIDERELWEGVLGLTYFNKRRFLRRLFFWYVNARWKTQLS